MNITDFQYHYFAALIKLKECDEIKYPSSGLCTNLYYMFIDSISSIQHTTNEIVGYVSESWFKFSGSFVYPVPSTNSFDTASDQYSTYHKNHYDMWNTDDLYGKLRLELLDFLISEFSLDEDTFIEKYGVEIKRIMERYGI